MRWIAQSGYQMAPKTPLLKWTRRFLAIFGSPLGAQKSPKIDFFPKKPSQGALFYRFLQRTSFSSIFWWIFGRFWMKNRWKQIVFFQAPLAFFPTWRLSRNTVFCELKRIIYFFQIIIFCTKMMKTTTANLTGHKSRKITPWGAQNGRKIIENSLKECLKSQKLQKR